jgi:hypothetical protein
MTGWIFLPPKVLHMIRSTLLVSLSACKEQTGYASIYSCSIINYMSTPQPVPIAAIHMEHGRHMVLRIPTRWPQGNLWVHMRDMFRFDSNTLQQRCNTDANQLGFFLSTVQLDLSRALYFLSCHDYVHMLDCISSFWHLMVLGSSRFH